MTIVSNMSYTDLEEYKLTINLEHYVPPVLFAIGITGNILSMIVLTRPDFRKTATGLSLLSLAITDSLVLVISVFLVWLMHVTEFDLLNKSEIVCKLHTFITYVLIQLSAWILVLLTIERVYAVFMPFRARFVFSRRRVLISMFGMCLFSVGLNAHLLYGIVHISKQNGTNSSTVCYFSSDHETFMKDIWPWIDFLFAFAIPFCVLLVGNFIILCRIRSSRDFRREAVRGQQEGTGSDRIRTLTAVVLNVVFLVLVSPYQIFNIGHKYWFSHDMDVKRALIYSVTLKLMYTNNAINFLVYMLTGRKFRQQLRQLCKCCRSERTDRSGNGTSKTAYQTQSAIHDSQVQRL